MSSDPQGNPLGSGVWRRARVVQALAVILLIGLFVRVYGVWEQSFWWDEFTSMVHLSPPEEWQESPDYARWNWAVVRETAPNLFGFWAANRGMDPATMPLYYSFQYLWNRYVSHDWDSLRVFPMVMGLLLIPVIYLFGSRLFGPGAGLIAAACLALSPIHRQFAQEIRMYSLMTLLALLSCYSFYLLTQKRDPVLLARCLKAAMLLAALYAVLFALAAGIHATGAAGLDRDSAAVAAAAVAFATAGALFVVALRSRGNRTLWFHALVNLLLFWTHPFALLVPFVQGVFWLVFRSTDFRRLVGWGVLHAVLLIPSAVYISTIQFWEQDSTAAWMKLPTGAEFMGDLLGDDCVGMTWQLAPLNATWEPMAAGWERVLPERAASRVVSFAPLAGRLMMLGFVIAAAWLLFASLRRPAPDSDGAGGTGGTPRWKWTVFLLLWWFAPAMVLLLVSVSWRACIMPRYTLHSSLALYLILGGAIANISPKLLRQAAAMVLIAAFAYQQSLVLAGPGHPDYRSAGRSIREAAEPCDLILVHNWLWKRVFAFNFGPTPNVVGYASDFDILAEQCRFYLELELPAPGAARERCGVWAVIRKDYFLPGPEPAFERALTARGLQAQLTAFPGIQYVLLYWVTRNPRAPVATLPAPLGPEAPKEFADLALEFWRAQEYDLAVEAAQKAAAIEPDYARAWSYIGMSYKEMGLKEAAIEAFSESITREPQGYPDDWINLADLYNDLRRYDEAAAMVSQALQFLPSPSPSVSFAYSTLGRAKAGLGDAAGAAAAFEKAIELDPGDQRPRVRLERLGKGELDAAAAPW